MMKQLVISALALCAATTGHGQTINDALDLTLRPGWRTADGTHMAGIDIRLAPGWKTYWRQPGDAGIPPIFDWSGSENLRNVQVMWPEPLVEWPAGMRSIGYRNHVVWPLRVVADGPGPVTLDATIQLGVCEEICIPVTVSFRAELPAQGAYDQDIQNGIEDQIPQARQTVTCQFEPTDDSISIELMLPRTGTNPPDVVVEVADPSFWIATPMVTAAPDGWLARTELLAPSGRPTGVSRSDIRVTAFGHSGAVEYKGCDAG